MIACVWVFRRHAVFVSRLWSVVIAVDADAAPAYCLILGSQRAGGNRRVTVVMILRVIAVMLVLIIVLVAIAACDAIADELNAAVWTLWKTHQRTVLVEDESPELSPQLITLYDVGEFHVVLACRQCRCQLHYAVLLSHERHLERLGIVNLCHEVSAPGLCHHT